MPPQDVDAALAQREENEILRRKITEIGAAIIRAAEAAPDEDIAKSGLSEKTLSQKATA